MDETTRTAIATESGARGWRRSVIALSLILVSSGALPRAASAQLTTCALEGEYLLSGMMDLGTGPLYVGGLFVFQPGTPCAPGVSGIVSITVVYSPPGTPNTLYSANLPYMGDDTLITIGPGLMQGTPTGIVDGLITSMPMAGGGALRLTGFLSRRDLPALTDGLPGPARTDRRHRSARAARWRQGRPVRRGRRVRRGQPGRRGPQVRPDQSAAQGRQVRRGQPGRRGPRVRPGQSAPQGRQVRRGQSVRQGRRDRPDRQASMGRPDQPGQQVT